MGELIYLSNVSNLCVMDSTSWLPWEGTHILAFLELGKDLESWILVEFVLVHFIQFLNYFFQKIQVFTNSWNLLEFFVVQNSRKFNSLIDKKLELEDIFERLHKIESFEIKVGEQTWFKMITTVKNCIVFKINEVLSGSNF